MQFIHNFFYWCGYIIPCLITLKQVLRAIDPFLYDLYIGLMIPSILYFILLLIGRYSLKKSCLGFYVYTLFLLFSIVLARNIEVYFLGLIGYLFFPLYWYLYFRLYKKFDIQKFVFINYILAIVVALFGYFQYFVDPTIFGIVSFEDSKDISTHLIPRMYSIVGSPQVMGFYLIINLILSDVFLQRKNCVFRLFDCLILIAALLTGNRGVFLNVVVYYGIRVIVASITSKSNIVKLIAIFGLFSVILFYSTIIGFGLQDKIDTSNINVTLNRTVSLLLLSEQTFSDQESRLNIYRDAWEESDLLIGNGIGTTSPYVRNFLGVNIFVTESYLLSIVYEMGMPGLIFFHIFWFSLMSYSRKINVNGFQHVLIAIYVNMIIVHAFFGIFTGFVWGAIFYILVVGKFASCNALENTNALPHSLPA